MFTVRAHRVHGLRPVAHHGDGVVQESLAALLQHGVRLLGAAHLGRALVKLAAIRGVRVVGMRAVHAAERLCKDVMRVLPNIMINAMRPTWQGDVYQ